MAPSARALKSARSVAFERLVNLRTMGTLAWSIGNASSAIAPGVRLRPWTYVNGMRLCIRAQNRIKYATELHWALVQEKRALDGSGVASGATEFKPDFFRDNRQAQLDTFKDFTDQPGSGAIWNFRYSCGRINSMKFRVLKHQKVFLAGEPTEQGDTSFKGLGHIYHCEKYFKMHKRISFGTAADTVGNYPVYFVYWVTRPTPDNYPSTQSTNEIRLAVEMVTYYDAYEAN